MPLNPLREPLSQLGRAARQHETPFQSEAEAALARLRSVRGELEQQVRRGDLTVKAARGRAGAVAAEIRNDLLARCKEYSPAPRAFLDRLVEVTKARKVAQANASLEALQRETNRLLRQSLVEQQIVTRSAEFEAQGYVRPLDGGASFPTVGSLLTLHDRAALDCDDAAQEWARRQLEAIRPRVSNPEDQKRIDMACDRPDRVQPAVVLRYIQALEHATPEDMEKFATEAIAAQDSSACCAAFALARMAPEGLEPRWCRIVLQGVKDFPDAALNVLRDWEAEARNAEAEAALAGANYAIAVAVAEAEMPKVEAPSASDIERQERIGNRPVAAPNEPIGLTLLRRGLNPQEFADLQAPQPMTDD